MIISPSSVVVSSRSVASCTTPFDVVNDRFELGRWHRDAFRTPSAIPAIFSDRSKRRDGHLLDDHVVEFVDALVGGEAATALEAIRDGGEWVSPVRPSRESITLSSTCAQKGHFTRQALLDVLGVTAFQFLLLALLFVFGQTFSVRRATFLRESTAARPPGFDSRKRDDRQIKIAAAAAAPFSYSICLHSHMEHAKN